MAAWPRRSKDEDATDPYYINSPNRCNIGSAPTVLSRHSVYTASAGQAQGVKFDLYTATAGQAQGVKFDLLYTASAGQAQV